MCFAPQRRALFRHRNFQKCSGAEVFCTFWLRNVLRPTTACTFSTSQLQKVLRTWSVFSVFTCKCASCHNAVHFLDSATSKSAPQLRCFVHFDFEMCFVPQRRAIFHLSSGQLAFAPAALASLLFDPPEPQIIGKTPCFATFLHFRAPGSSFFWDFLFCDLLSSLLFSSLTLPISAFHLSILSEVWLLNFLRWVVCGGEVYGRFRDTPTAAPHKLDSFSPAVWNYPPRDCLKQFSVFSTQCMCLLTL